ncbi:Pyridoxine/pyridoxamine 5'-phosphate oxidase [Clavibacter michiganensis subsp. michiganensis]|uniref:Pyridoxine/pyridoxamine 5'-phosphate oxidase n=2 Tax=Clavibacter michiganensis TaxID=28447 RepID=A0A251XLL7_CLAMM|nr:Pyridoxine/pyridoxamine 5'-phosphate oxidase [Clavibacter michiganensis subsp. michiganensis]OUE04367.1 Pyridoxine/pyridoxamine 5'-phosphate oxidase [Clavibacter michiganensis subsp. michiganensis]
MPTDDLARWLRALPSLTGSAPPLDLDALPDDPDDLFRTWITEAVDAGVPEPHAATLATVDADGLPDARTLILKDVGPRGWAFAGTRSSAKGAQLAASPAAALAFWWQPIVRAVRVRGSVEEATAEESAADLAARSAAARADVDPGGWVLWRIRPCTWSSGRARPTGGTRGSCSTASATRGRAAGPAARAAPRPATPPRTPPSRSRSP